MTQVLSLNTQFIAHSSANLTEYLQNFTKGLNLLLGELKMFLNQNCLPNKRNTLRTCENYVRILCRIPNEMLSHQYFSELPS